MAVPLTTHEKEFRRQRLEHLEALRGAGERPFGRAFARSGTLGEMRANFREGRGLRLAGRVVGIREMGRAQFAHIQDGTGRFQVYVQKNAVGEGSFWAWRKLDIGDFIGVEGECFMTRSGEPTLRVAKWELLAKALLPLPEKWHGLSDMETRYRERELDLVANPGIRRIFDMRSRMISHLRRMLEGRGFFEVETPVLQARAGGAAATPFCTHYGALSQEMFLRIAPELYLKRLLVGGYDKVFELGKDFRNEGLDRSHNPEFTVLEIYEAYGDCRSMMRLLEELVSGVAEAVTGGTRVRGSTDGGAPEIELAAPWRVVTYRDVVKEHAGGDWFERTAGEAREWARGRGLEISEGATHGETTKEVYEKLIEKTLWQPTFVTRLPAELVPLAKRCEDDPGLVDVFEMVVKGRELCPGYTELNDPVEQRARLEAQAGGEAGKVDEDFLRALEHGMPPAGGMGIGIDRLAMILTASESIRDVMLFPQMKNL